MLTRPIAVLGAALLTAAGVLTAALPASAAVSAAGASHTAAQIAAARQELLKLVAQGHGPTQPTSVKNGGADTPNWAGYVDTGKGYSSVSGSWTQPAITCSPGEDGLAYFWVGIDGFNGTTVEQDGTASECDNGKPFYWSWWEMFPSGIHPEGDSVAPGDLIRASVRRNGNTYTLTVTDVTHPANSFSGPKTRSGDANATAEWIAEGATSHISDFHDWHLSNATVDGGNITAHPDINVTMTGPSGGIRAEAGALNSTHNGFVVDWVHT